jgi:hypothetical protein
LFASLFNTKANYSNNNTATALLGGRLVCWFQMEEKSSVRASGLLPEPNPVFCILVGSVWYHHLFFEEE